MEYIPRTAMKKLIITDQTFPLEKNLNSITAEALNIEDNILFNNSLKDEIIYHWIDYLVPFPSDRLGSHFLHSKCRLLVEINVSDYKMPGSSIIFSFRD